MAFVEGVGAILSYFDLPSAVLGIFVSHARSLLAIYQTNNEWKNKIEKH